jgi:AraC-like DNA-binding protein
MSSDDRAGEPGTAPGAVRGMLQAMGAVGVDVDRLCAAVGISEAGLAGRTDPLALAELAPIWRKATAQFGRGTLGLHVGAAHRPGMLLDYVAGASPDLRASLGQIARYIGLASRNVRWVIGPRDGDGVTMFEEQATYAPDAIPPQLREFGVALCATRLHAWFDRRPREAWFMHAAQGPLDEYQQILGCPARFERDRAGLRFDDEALVAPARSHDPDLFRLLESHADKVLADTPTSASFRARVRHAVVQRLREGEPAIDAIATALATSPRSLQRKLQTEGLSFRDVVDEARHKLAVVYLGDTSLSLTDVACLLGYSEAAAFTRAFKRWTGQPPSHARGT